MFNGNRLLSLIDVCIVYFDDIGITFWVIHGGNNIELYPTINIQQRICKFIGNITTLNILRHPGYVKFTLFPTFITFGDLCQMPI